MGLPMNVHAPSIPSASASSESATDLLSLISQKDSLEAELKALGSVLDSHGVNMNTPLCTFDGYPRDDIDVAQIRTTRAKIIPLRNDYKALMLRIEKGLHAHHHTLSSSLPEPAPETTHSGGGAGTGVAGGIIEAPFARVDSVEGTGPAGVAGVRVGDLVKRFGSVGALGGDALKRVGEEVGRYEGRVLKVLVSRRDGEGVWQNVTLEITPRAGWGGRGLLGCYLLPV